MGNGFSKSGSGGLRWVILLLGVAVILPTVCLLWFMVQAVRNERLAFEQKQKDFFLGQLKTNAEEYLGYRWVSLNFSTDNCDALLRYDHNGILIFPIYDETEASADDPVFDAAYALEYEANDLQKAIEEYYKISETSDSNEIRISADLFAARCLKKLGLKERAAAQLEKIISSYIDDDFYVCQQKCYAGLLKLDLIRDMNDGPKFIEDTLDYALRNESSISSSLQILVLRKCIEYSQAIQNHGLQEKISHAQKLIDSTSRSLMILEECQDDLPMRTRPLKSPVYSMNLDTGEQFYCIHTVSSDYHSLEILNLGSMRSVFESYISGIGKVPMSCKVYDEKGRLVTGTDTVFEGAQALLKVGLASSWFPGWQVELFVDDAANSKAVRRQEAVYRWTGVLVVVLILGSGGAAGQVVGRQIRLNRLKNDFIATVTHELKTPLASMRVLVDTLLEERCESEHQEREYLQLISKENVRLSRLIDNFLTFSRMERNKQAFEMVEADAGEIARAAAQAVQTKFNDENCEFSVRIEEGLTSIIADKDAMVTVLVNLLDNAYKYSYDEKRIELRVYGEEGKVCFSVKDNGIGMNRRQVKKVFDRFYQADNSLARQAEGTGLGLSIVKFIVDAHKGEIEVDSRLGKGSEFVVKLTTD